MSLNLERNDKSSVISMELPVGGHLEQNDVDERVKGVDMMSSMREQMTRYVFVEGRQRAEKAFGLYANIDILRPYFHVEPKELRDRLVNSLFPRFSSASKPVLIGELYGPLMLVFTLIALLLYGMKTSGHVVKEGTLMGTAFGVCFGYWFGASSFIYFLAYVCNARVSFIQTLSLLGYSLFGHCIVLFLSTVFHSDETHFVFYLLWAVFGSLSALKMMSMLMARTPGPSQRFLLHSSIAIVHMLFLLFLHFAYHQAVEGY